jgi:hypothetical protein
MWGQLHHLDLILSLERFLRKFEILNVERYWVASLIIGIVWLLMMTCPQLLKTLDHDLPLI